LSVIVRQEGKRPEMDSPLGLPHNNSARVVAPGLQKRR
jgi:hypothetical protein